MKAGDAWRDSEWHRHGDFAEQRAQRRLGRGGGVGDGGVNLEHTRLALPIDDSNRLPVGQCVTELHRTH